MSEPDLRRRGDCPTWCRSPHGVNLDEEDWIHSSEPLRIADDVVAHLCMSVDPHTGATDGPYVVIGSTEYSPVAAMRLAMSLLALAGLAVAPSATFGHRDGAQSDGR